MNPLDAVGGNKPKADSNVRPTTNRTVDPTRAEYAHRHYFTKSELGVVLKCLKVGYMHLTAHELDIANALLIRYQHREEGKVIEGKEVISEYLLSKDPGLDRESL